MRKEIILEQALILFSQKGYDATSMRSIAEASGLKVSSLYSHFPSKEAIYQGIIALMEERYQEVMASLKLSDEVPSSANFYENIQEAELQSIAEKLFLHFAFDPFASRCKQLLSLRRYESEENRQQYDAWFIQAPITFQQQLFASLMARHVFKEGDSHATALAFYGPIYLMIDRYSGKEAEKRQATEELKAHIHHFVQTQKTEVEHETL